MRTYRDNMTENEQRELMLQISQLDYIYSIVEQIDNKYDWDEDEIDYDDPAWDLQIYQFVSRQLTDEQFDILCQSVYYRVWAYA